MRMIMKDSATVSKDGISEVRTLECSPIRRATLVAKMLLTVVKTPNEAVLGRSIVMRSVAMA